MTTTIEPKAKPGRPRKRRASWPRNPTRKAETPASWQRNLAQNPEAGIQISLRLPAAVLFKLQRLADSAVQSKSQYVTKWILDLPDAQ